MSSFAIGRCWPMARSSRRRRPPRWGGPWPRIPQQPGGAEDRAGLARRLHGALRQAAVPVFEPAGGHGVFVDAQAFLHHLPAAAHPTAALCNALYVAGGLRAGANPAAASEETEGPKEVLRLALPLGQTEAEGEAAVVAIVAAFERVAAERGANPSRA